jgi:hypothetical protein
LNADPSKNPTDKAAGDKKDKKPKVLELDTAELTGTLFWFCHVKKVFSQAFPHFFKPAKTMGGKFNVLEAANAQIRALDEEIAAAQIYGIFETVPTYCALTIHYDPVRIRYEELRAKIEELMKKAHSTKQRRPTVIEIPVCYGGEFGPDIENVAKHAGISVEEVIKIHTAPE